MTSVAITALNCNPLPYLGCNAKQEGKMTLDCGDNDDNDDDDLLLCLQMGAFVSWGLLQ